MLEVVIVVVVVVAGPGCVEGTVETAAVEVDPQAARTAARMSVTSRAIVPEVIFNRTKIRLSVLSGTRHLQCFALTSNDAIMPLRSPPDSTPLPQQLLVLGGVGRVTALVAGTGAGAGAGAATVNPGAPLRYELILECVGLDIHT